MSAPATADAADALAVPDEPIAPTAPVIHVVPVTLAAPAPTAPTSVATSGLMERLSGLPNILAPDTLVAQAIPIVQVGTKPL